MGERGLTIIIFYFHTDIKICYVSVKVAEIMIRDSSRNQQRHFGAFFKVRNIFRFK